MEKKSWDGPKWGWEGLFPANPDLADILGDTDFDFENLYFLDFLGSQLGPGLGPTWSCTAGSRKLLIGRTK